MKTQLASVAIAIFLTQGCTTIGTTRPVIEQGIYRPKPPFVDLKQQIYVRERERLLLPRITNASNSIIQFILDMYNPKVKTVGDMWHVLTGSQAVLRLPPPATSSTQGRFVAMSLYCWESDNEDQLKFFVEWADIGTMARYTDSYVFVRRGSFWYFEKHGSVAPWHWTKAKGYFQRQCPA